MSILRYIMSGDTMTAIIMVLSRCFVVFCCLPFHEFSHAYVAYKMGDDTAKRKGRLTLNPFAHLNPLGTIMIFLFGIGYAAPVPVNIGKFKNPKKGMAIVALAGPVSNILMAFVCAFFSTFFSFISIKFLISSTLLSAIIIFFEYAASINCMLAVFNLIPIPPLDGSRVVNAVLPYKAYYKIMQYERYIMIGFMIILFMGFLDGPLSALASMMYKLVDFLPKLIFGLLL